MNRAVRSLSVFALSLTAVVSGCSSGSDDTSGAPAGSSPMRIVSCSLGCNSTGGDLTCVPKAVFRNDTISIGFNQEVDPNSVNKSTIRIVDDSTGIVPQGALEIDPADPKRVRFRPSLTFDSQGNPIFGLRDGGAYTVTILGTDTFTGPAADLVRSRSNRPNTTTLECNIAATLGVRDVKVGQPRVEVFYDVVTAVDPGTGDVTAVDFEVLANGSADLTDVWRGTQIKVEFDDLMNPSTVVNPVTGIANLITVEIDGDGNVNTDADRLDIFGNWDLSLDQDDFITTAFFRPSEGLPSAGIDLDTPRLLIVTIPPGVSDLGDNQVVNQGPVTGAIEYFFFDEELLPGGEGEDFSDEDNRDPLRTGAFWGSTDFGDGSAVGLTAGIGGGSGRLGDLVVTLADSPVVLNVDNQTFDGGELIDNYDPVTGMPAAGESSYTVTDGIFEFASVRVDPGAFLRFEGSQPARLFARGTALIEGTIDVSAADVGSQATLPCDVTEDDETRPFYCFFLEDDFDPMSMDPEEYADLFRGGKATAGGPGGGDGGKGGDLIDPDESLVVVDFPEDLGIMGIPNPNAVIELDGEDGIGVPAYDDPGTLVGNGQGGEIFPATPPPNADDLGADLVIANKVADCTARRSPISGSGGGNATRGANGENGFIGSTGTPKVNEYGPAAAPTVGGDASQGFVAEVETLDPELGYLRGGAGGGGSGAGFMNTKLNGLPTACLEPPVGESLIADFVQNTGMGGGGGGGALQIQAAARLALEGVLNAAGGSGGQRFTSGDLRVRLGAAGGSGAGGSLLIQSEQLELSGLPNRILVNGGGRSQGGGLSSFGGRGGSGRIRVESGTEPDELLALETVDALIQPDSDVRKDLPGKPKAEDIMTISLFEQETGGPGLTSGAASCWLKPDGNVFFVSYFEDEPGQLGWDMDVYINDLGQSISWREVGALTPGMSAEELYTGGSPGGDLGDSPIVVRFQAARAVAPIANLCDVDLDDDVILGSSITPWVRHPAELNDFFDNELRRPNLIRFQILFDRSHEMADDIGAVTSFRIRAQGE